jgi:hypothetical protein
MKLLHGGRLRADYGQSWIILPVCLRIAPRAQNVHQNFPLADNWITSDNLTADIHLGQRTCLGDNQDSNANR